MAEETMARTITPADGGQEAPRSLADYVKRLARMRETGLILIIVALFIGMSFASPYFLTWVNMRAMAMAFAVEGIVVVGMTILLISGGIDLSVGSVTALAMVIAGLLFLNGVDPWTASAISILACAGIGAFMGFFVTRVGLHHFIVSLAVMVIARGACLLGTGGRPLGLRRQRGQRAPRAARQLRPRLFLGHQPRHPAGRGSRPAAGAARRPCRRAPRG